MTILLPPPPLNIFSLDRYLICSTSKSKKSILSRPSHIAIALGMIFAATSSSNAAEIFDNLNQAKENTSHPYKTTNYVPTRGWAKWFGSNAQNKKEGVSLVIDVKDVPYDTDVNPLVGYDIFGGVADGQYDTTTVQNNTVEVKSHQGLFSRIHGAFSYNGNVENNTVILDGNSNLTHGGYSVKGDAVGNKVYATNVTYSISTIEGGTSDEGEANNNYVYLSNSSGAIVVSGGSGDGAKNNTVEVVNSTVESITGGASPTYYPLQADIDNTGNRVILRGKVEATYAIFGATSNYTNGQGDTGFENSPFDKDNTIVISGTVRTRAFSGFDTLNIELTKENQTTAALTYNYWDPSYGVNYKVTDPQSFKDRVINITFSNGLTCCGDYKILARDSNANVKNEIAMDRAVVNVNDGLIKRSWRFEDNSSVEWLNLTGGTLNGKVADTTESSFGSSILSESLLASIAFVNEGAEFIADDGMNAITAAATPERIVTFGSAHGGSSRYNTGSKVDLRGGGLVVGAAGQNHGVTFAGFIESGWATSDSHVDGTRADGDHDYYGLGGALRLQATDALHVDASARLGWVTTKFKGSVAETVANYDATALYMTSHVSAGYQIDLSEKIRAELYGRYVYSILHGDTAKVARYEFESKATHTHTLRAGVRLNGDLSPALAWRVGAAYEHVFGGEAKSQINCGSPISLDIPSLAGDVGIVELGTILKPAEGSPWSFDFAVKGYAGDRRGVSGNATVLYSF